MGFPPCHAPAGVVYGAQQMAHPLQLTQQVLAAQQVLAMQMAQAAAPQPAPLMGAQGASPPAAVVPLPPHRSQARGKRGGKRRGSVNSAKSDDSADSATKSPPAEAEERRTDPTDGKMRNFLEFMLRHSVGADFSKGERLWEEARPRQQQQNEAGARPERRQGPDEDALRWQAFDRADSDEPPPLIVELQ